MNCKFCNKELKPYQTSKGSFYYCKLCKTEFMYDYNGNLLRCHLKKDDKQVSIDYYIYKTFFYKDHDLVLTIDCIANINPENLDDKFNLYVLMS